MIKATFRNYPTNYTSNHVRTFSTLESALRDAKQRDSILVAIEEDGVGFHKVPLTEKGAVSLSPLEYGVPRGGTMHYSEKFKEIEKMLNDESNKPKLA